MKTLGIAARSAQRKEATLLVVSLGLVLLTTLAVLGGMGALALLGAVALIALAVMNVAVTGRTARDGRDQHLADVAARLHHIDAERRDAQARMHAIRSIVAGIVSATQLLKSLPEDRRDSFESMVDAELDRLTRILRDETTTRTRSISLDDLLAHVVTSHRSRGRTVTWEPSGLRLLGRYDDVAEVVNILIDNAAVHGDADDIRVAAEHDSGTVTITVTDSGPGIPAELRNRIFRWGEQRPDSPGEGIGLNFAQTLVRELRGDLYLDETYRAGTRFTLTLPATADLFRGAREDLRVAG